MKIMLSFYWSLINISVRKIYHPLFLPSPNSTVILLSIYFATQILLYAKKITLSQRLRFLGTQIIRFQKIKSPLKIKNSQYYLTRIKEFEQEFETKIFVSKMFFSYWNSFSRWFKINNSKKNWRIFWNSFNV